MSTKKEGEGFLMSDSNKEEPTIDPLQVDFSTFIMSLATNVLINLGLIESQEGGSSQPNLPLANQNIKLLEIISEKTKGNLTDSENELLKNLLTEVRMRYVEKSKS